MQGALQAFISACRDGRHLGMQKPCTEGCNKLSLNRGVEVLRWGTRPESPGMQQLSKALRLLDASGCSHAMQQAVVAAVVRGILQAPRHT